MRRLPVLGWSFLVSVWAGLVGGVTVYLPSVDVVQLYTIGFQLAAWPVAYWTIRRNQARFAAAHRMGRVVVFILVFFGLSGALSTAANTLLGHVSTVAVAVQLAAFAVSLAVALQVTFAGGVEYVWDTYT